MWQCYSSLLDCSLLLKVDFGQQLLCPLLQSVHRKLLDVVCAELFPPLNYTPLPVFALSCLNKEHLGLFERNTKDCSGCVEHWEEDVFKAKTAFHVAVLCVLLGITLLPSPGQKQLRVKWYPESGISCSAAVPACDEAPTHYSVTSQLPQTRGKVKPQRSSTDYLPRDQHY